MIAFSPWSIRTWLSKNKLIIQITNYNLRFKIDRKSVV